MKTAVAAALYIVADLIICGPARAAIIEEKAPARIAADPEAYVGRTVTTVVKFTKIDNGTEPWEEQANLKAGSKIKFTAAPLGAIKCYADRTPRNIEALSGLKKGKRLILTGVVRRYQTKVRATYHQRLRAVRRWIKVTREEKGRVRYGFIVGEIERAH